MTSFEQISNIVLLYLLFSTCFSVFTCRLLGTTLLNGKAAIKYYNKSNNLLYVLLFSEQVFLDSNKEIN